MSIRAESMSNRLHRGRAGRCPAVVLCLLLAAPWSAAAAEAPGAATPEALVARLQAAAESGDLVEVAACMTPDDRAEMTVGMLVVTGMMVAFSQMGGEMAEGMAEGMADAFGEGEPSGEQRAAVDAGRAEMEAKAGELEARYTAILDKHGLAERMGADPPENTGGTGTQAMREMLAGVDDVALLGDLFGLLEEIGEGDAMSGESKLPEGPIEVVSVEGDRATARAGDQTVEMVRIDGRWYFEAPKGDAGDGGDAGDPTDGSDSGPEAAPGSDQGYR
jgi:hypothetical protein